MHHHRIIIHAIMSTSYRIIMTSANGFAPWYGTYLELEPVEVVVAQVNRLSRLRSVTCDLEMRIRICIRIFFTFLLLHWRLATTNHKPTT
jgi:hypothetical protein